MKETVTVERLIRAFESMSQRGTLITKPENQGDLLNQIIGTIVRVAMSEEREEKRDE